MEPLAPILIGASVAAVVLVAVRRVVRARLAGRGIDSQSVANRVVAELTFIVLGVLLMVLAVVVGQRILAIDEPPRGELFAAGVGIVPPVAAKADRGFIASLGARFRSCEEPVEVSIVLAGSAEYFEDHRTALRRRTRLTVSVPDTDLGNVRMSYGDDYDDLFSPVNARRSPDADVTLNTDKPRAHRVVTSIGARMERWAEHVVPLVVRFDADWLVPRGLGTCYLKLPPLTGEPSIIAAQDGRGRSSGTVAGLHEAFADTSNIVFDRRETIFVPYDRMLMIRRGIAAVEPGKNEILGSEPDTEIVSGGLPAHACVTRAPTTGALGDRRAELLRGSEHGGFAVRDRSFTDLAHQRDCSAVVTLAEAGAASRRDFVLLVIGALFSLGAALVLEMLLDMQRRRHERNAAAAAMA